MNKGLIKLDTDLINSSATKIAVCLCVDISGSMGTIVDDRDFVCSGQTAYIDGKTYNLGSGGKSRMDVLLHGIETFITTIKKDPIARRSVELSVIAFNEDIRVLSEFKSIDAITLPSIEPEGNTDIGNVVLAASALLEERKKMYKTYGVEYYRPILVLMSDGENNGSSSTYNAACKRIHEYEELGKISTILIGMGPDSDLEEMSRLSGKRPAKQLSDEKFDEFFRWLSKSVSVVSQSTPGDRIPLPPTSGWEDL